MCDACDGYRHNTVNTLYLATHHFTVTLQAISGLSPTTSVISTLPYDEETLTSLYSVTFGSRSWFANHYRALTLPQSYHFDLGHLVAVKYAFSSRL